VLGGDAGPVLGFELGWWDEAHEFRVRGVLSQTVLAAFPELSRGASPTPGGTVLFGPVRDDRDVLSIVTRFGDLGLSVVELRQLPD
jgi:hypothetical protein